MNTDGQTDGDGDWLVLFRDVSGSVKVRGESRIVAGLVFEMGTGLVLGSSMGTDEDEAIVQVCQLALASTAGGRRPRRPDRVLCSPELAPRLVEQLHHVKGMNQPPPVTETDTVHEAEDVFDALVGHLAGRGTAVEFAAPADWQLLYQEASRFCSLQPWARWADDVDLLLRINGPITSDHVAIVLGHEGVQRGLVLYPGLAPPAGLRDHHPGWRGAVPPGTLMSTLDSPIDVPEEFTNRAKRYGWPADSDLVPVFLTVTDDGAQEPSRTDVQTLTIALAAVSRHDEHRASRRGNASQATRDGLALGDGGLATFGICELTADPERHVGPPRPQRQDPPGNHRPPRSRT